MADPAAARVRLSPAPAGCRSGVSMVSPGFRFSVGEEGAQAEGGSGSDLCAMHTPAGAGCSGERILPFFLVRWRKGPPDAMRGTGEGEHDRRFGRLELLSSPALSARVLFCNLTPICFLAVNSPAFPCGEAVAESFLAKAVKRMGRVQLLIPSVAPSYPRFPF